MWREQKKWGCLDLMNLQLEQRGKRLIAGEVGGGGWKQSDTKGLK